MNPKSIGKLLIAIFVCQLAGIIGSIFTAPAIQTWYAELQKPLFTPPSFVFAPVWLTLYTLMGISLYLIWQKGFKQKKVKIALTIFGAQLFLNALWSILFFGLQNPLLAFAEIVLLWVLIAVMIIKFYPISRKAALLLLPYLAWVTIASALNFSVWILNA